MTSDSPGTPPISPSKINMIFNSDDFAALMKSNDMDVTKVFQSSDSAAALFRSADFVNSLDAYKESLAKAPPLGDATAANGNADPSAFFRSIDFLKSMDSFPKDAAGPRESGAVDYSSYFKSIDALPKDLFKSLEVLPKQAPVPAPAPAPVIRSGTNDLYSSRDWVGAYHPSHVDVAYDNKLFHTSDSKDASAAAVPAESDPSSKWMKMYESGLKERDSKDASAAAAPAESDSTNKWMKMYESGLKPSAIAPVSVPASVPAKESASTSWKGLYESVLKNPMQNVADASLLIPSMPLLVAEEARPSAVALEHLMQDVTNASSTPPMPPLGAEEARPSVVALKHPMQSVADASLLARPMPPLGAEAARPSVVPAASQATSTNDDQKAATSKPKKKRVYKSRKVIPEVKTYVAFTDNDVLLGRGGLSNKHPGNRRYRQEIENAKAVYRSASKDEKTQWASLLVEYVQKYGGRFLEKDKANGQWYIVPDVVARRKAGQALREDNTPESRMEKRERYKQNHRSDN